jgi:hypothetical protein
MPKTKAARNARWCVSKAAKEETMNCKLTSKMPKTKAARNARWRVSKAAKEEAMVAELNAKRAHFNLPKVTLKLPRASLKGTKRNEYAPPADMIGEELKQWKADDRKRRKALAQAENRRKRRVLFENMKEQLSALTEAIEQKPLDVVKLSNVMDAEDLKKVICALNLPEQGLVNEWAGASKPMPVQSAQPPSDTLDSQVQGDDPLIDIDINGLISQPLIQSKDVETAILSDTSFSSSDDDNISIPITHVFDVEDDAFAIEAVDEESCFFGIGWG